MKIRVLPTLKNKMYTFGQTVSISYGYLETLTDNCLITSLYHERGHILAFKKMVILFILSCVFFTELLFIFPIIFYPILYICCYAWLCFLARCGEYRADYYAFIKTDKQSMIEFYQSMNKDNVPWPLYIFRYHPNIKRRLKRLEAYDIKEVD